MDRKPGWFQEKTTKELWRWDGEKLMCLVNGVWVDYGDGTCFTVPYVASVHDPKSWGPLKRIGPLKALALGATRTEVLNLQ